MNSEGQMTTTVDEGKIRDALNAHGIFFKKAVRREIEKIEGVTILGEEYPVRYMEGASLDLLVELSSDDDARVIFSIECKRAYARRKKWIFFEDREELSNLYAFSGKDLRAHYGSSVGPICVEGVEIDEDRLTKDAFKAASPDPIWQAARQTCKGYLGFVQQEFTERRKPQSTSTDRLILVPVLVTTAPLFVAEVDVSEIDLSTGNLAAPLQLKPVPWVVLRHPFTPSYNAGEHHLRVNVPSYLPPLERGCYQKESIVVLNAMHIREVFAFLTDDLNREEGFENGEG